MQSIPLWLVSVLGSLIITVLSFILILTVYGRFFRLYLYTALAPIPLAAFAGEGTSAAGKAFLKSYTGVCMEGAVIVLSCLIYSAFLSSSTPAADTTLPAVTMVWQYVGQLVFNMLILTGLVKYADRLGETEAKETKSYIYRLTVSTALNMKKQQDRYVAKEDEELIYLVDSASQEDEIERVFREADSREALRQAMEHLSEEEKILLAERYGRERSFAEIAELLNISRASSVRPNCSRHCAMWN